jgi:protoporphyrin/coproporphyrin ferrochelatase
MIVVPIAFVSDHVETLYEIDLEYGEVAKEHGVTGFTRAESLNSDDTFIAGMADLVSAHMASDKKCSVQLGLRCPGCINEKCGPAKEYFATV